VKVSGEGFMLYLDGKKHEIIQILVMADTEEQVEIAKLNLKDWEPGRGGN
jgi:hypothetical protein